METAMLQLINSLLRPRPRYYIDQAAADALIQEMDDRNDRALAAHWAATWEATQWDRANAAEVWATLSFDEKCEIFDHYDDLNAQGRLLDVPFYDQWRAARRKAC